MNAAQAKKIPLANLLSRLGYIARETRKSGNELWYESPFRPETTPSFKIKVDQNIWYDFGEGQGGNILDFVMKLKRCNLKEALAFIETNPVRKSKAVTIQPAVNEPLPLFDTKGSAVLAVKPLYHYALKEYLKERCIAPLVGYKYLKEIKYKVDNKEYFALGFPNRAGGWEVRSSVFKGCIGKKDISFIETGSSHVSVFEGYMDFLSCLTLLGQDKMEGDVLVMNSIALRTKAIEFIRAKEYKGVSTYFDNDKGGIEALKSFCDKLPGISIISYNHLYKSFNDLNDYLKSKAL